MTDLRKLRALRDPALDEVLNAIEGISGTVIESRSGVSKSTIRNWRNGKTRHPQNITLDFALRAAGLRRRIVPI